MTTAKHPTNQDTHQGNRARALRHVVASTENTRVRLAVACGAGLVPSRGRRPLARFALRPAGGRLIGGDGGESSPTGEERLTKLIKSTGAAKPIATAILDETVELLGIGQSARAVSLKQPVSQFSRAASSFAQDAVTLAQDAVTLGAVLLPLEKATEGHMPVARVA